MPSDKATALKLFKPASATAALGLAVSHLMTKPAFANLKFGEWSRILVGQINRGHYCFALDADNHALAALRYLLLFEAMLRSGQLSYGEIRDRESGRLQTLTYAVLLWQLFRALIEGALETLVKDLGPKIINKVLSAIDLTVEEFLTDALQMGPHQVSVQLKAEELGYL